MDLELSSLDMGLIISFFAIVFTLFFMYIKKRSMTFALILANIFVFIISIFYMVKLPNNGYVSLLSLKLGFQPIFLTGDFSQTYTLFTSMFAHSGFLHIIGNMMVFFFVGTALEERIGSKKFIVIYLLSGICGTLAHSLLNLGSDIPLVGASGAIFGIMGALVYAYPRDEIIMPIPLFIITVLRRIKVVYAVLLFAIIETVIVFLDVQDQTAHFAHLGGLVGGFILAAILLRGYKTHTKEEKTLYYDSFSPQKNKEIDFSKLEKLATTPELMEMLLKIKKENVPQVRDIWLEHFFDKANCPKCSSKINHFDRRIWCEKCGFKDSY